MGYSELKFKIDMAKTRHQHESSQLAAKHKKEMSDLLSQCNHKYEDGSSAIGWWEGNNRMSYGKECWICGKRM